MYKNFCIGIFLLFISTARAQFVGGNNDGFAFGKVSQSVCASTTPDYVFRGGNNDGASSGTITQSVCTVVTTGFVFQGGNNDGFASGTVTQSTCSLVTSDFVFQGGNNDGFGSGSITQSTCTILNPGFVYQGGNNDGFGFGTITQSTCTILNPDFIYYGGINDGFGSGSITQSTCAILTTPFIYYGGIKDGFGFGVAQQTVCPNITPLPITLLYFTAECNDKNMVFNWATATESNNHYFTVEKSEDATNWLALTTITGAGNSAQKKEYSYTTSQFKQLTYFRLRQTDYSGLSKTSDIISSDCSHNNGDILVYPNPTSDKIYIQLSNNIKIKEMMVVSTLGEVVLDRSLDHERLIELSLAELKNGVYFIKLLDEEGQLQEHKIILIK